MAKIERIDVLYENGSSDKDSKFKQIVVVHPAASGGLFETKILEGTVTSGEPEFKADNPDALVNFHPTLKEALADADTERGAALSQGFAPTMPR